MRPKFLVVSLLFNLLFLYGNAATEYVGNNLLLLLGFNTASKDFKPIKEFWLLDKNFENNYGGIKLSVNSITDKVEGILIAGENYQANGTKFLKCCSALPYGILLSDDTAALQTKLGGGQKLVGRNAMKFYQDKIAVEVSFTNANFETIGSVKFFNEAKVVPIEVKTAEQKKTSYAKIKNQEKYKQLEKATFLEIPLAEINKNTPALSTFKQAVLDVFKSYRESNFYSIKSSSKSSSNFWNYKFAYTTKLKIPGEKFNMLYSFPFYQSPLDFVSVIKEADAVDQSFVSSYKDFEKKLTENFSVSEGWTASCLANKESKVLSDLQFSNDKYGSVILDYSKNPKGKHILYLRFLLYSN